MESRSRKSSVSTSSSSTASSSNSMYPQRQHQPLYSAMVANLPRHLNSDRALHNVLKDFPKVKYIKIDVKVNGLAFIKSTDPEIVGKLKVLKELYGQQVQICEFIPKWKLEKAAKEQEKKLRENKDLQEKRLKEKKDVQEKAKIIN